MVNAKLLLLRPLALLLFALGLFALGAAPAMGTVIYGFEGDNGTLPTYPGVLADGWYVPNIGGDSPSAHLYSDFASLGLTAPQGGGNNFLALTGSNAGLYQRAQTNVDFGSASTWTISYDILNVSSNASGTFGGFFPVSTNRNFAAFGAYAEWDNASPTWSALYSVYDADGDPLNNGNWVSPGAAWTGLLQGQWYVESTTFDVTTDKILSLSITDMNTNSTTTASPADWYMSNGSDPLSGVNAIRFTGFEKGSSMLIDNVTLEGTDAPEPATLGLIGLGFVALGILRRRAL